MEYQEYSGAEIIIKLLERQGITTVAGIPGGTSLPIYDALRDSSIKHVLTRHEQGAGFLAQGMARVSGKAAVCLATSGPGATNLLTAIADAKLDSIPLVAITGQVSRPMIGTDAFQEVDTYGLTIPITKHNFFVHNTEDLLKIIPKAFEIAESGRPGPVVVDVPKDVQTQCIRVEEWPEPARPAPRMVCKDTDILRLRQMLAEAERPVLYVGGGIIASGCTEQLRELARLQSIPVACTLMGLGAFPADDPLYLGMLGMHGRQSTNLILEETDLLIALGVRFDDRATGKADEMCPKARIAHVDIDRSEIDKIKPASLSVCGDVCDCLSRLLPLLGERKRTEWSCRVADFKSAYPEQQAPADPLHPLRLMPWLAERLSPETIVTTDVGQHQMWVAQSYPFTRPRTLLTSGGLGTMGFGLPAALGAALAAPGRPVLCVSGDGSFMMNLQELATLAELQLPVKIFICNNGHLGLVRQQQELFYGDRTFASRFDVVPDFAQLAMAFGIRGVNLNLAQDPEQAILEALESPGPCVIDAPLAWQENVFPMVPPGAANREMIGGTCHA